MGAGSVVSGLKEAGLSVEIHDDHFEPEAPDEEWIVKVSEWGWIILTRDTRIRNRASERMAVHESRAILFVLIGRRNLSGSLMASMTIRALPAMSKYVRRYRPPFMAAVYPRGRLKLIDAFDEPLPPHLLNP